MTAPSDQNQQERDGVQGQGPRHHQGQLLAGVQQGVLVDQVHRVCVELKPNARGGPGSEDHRMEVGKGET